MKANVGGTPIREVVGSLVWIANQTRPNIANDRRVVARFSNDPKDIHWKVARKIVNHVKATADLSLMFRIVGEMALM